MSEALEQRRRGVIRSFARLIADDVRARDQGAGIDIDTISLGLVGAVNELLIEWYYDALPVDLDTLTDNCVTLFLRAFGAARS